MRPKKSDSNSNHHNWTDEEEDLLIEMWEVHHHLYDQSDRDYKNRDKRARTLMRMATRLGVHVDAVRTHLVSLRTIYGRLTNPKGKSGSAAKPLSPRQQHLKQRLTFLSTHMRGRRQTRSNLKSTSQAAEAHQSDSDDSENESDTAEAGASSQTTENDEVDSTAAASVASPQRNSAAASVASPQRNSAGASMPYPQRNSAAVSVASPQRNSAAASVASPQRNSAAASVQSPQSNSAAAASVAPPQRNSAAASVAPPDRNKTREGHVPFSSFRTSAQPQATEPIAPESPFATAHPSPVGQDQGVATPSNPKSAVSSTGFSTNVRQSLWDQNNDGRTSTTQASPLTATKSPTPTTDGDKSKRHPGKKPLKRTASAAERFPKSLASDTSESGDEDVSIVGIHRSSIPKISQTPQKFGTVKKRVTKKELEEKAQHDQEEKRILSRAIESIATSLSVDRSPVQSVIPEEEEDEDKLWARLIVKRIKNMKQDTREDFKEDVSMQALRAVRGTWQPSNLRLSSNPGPSMPQLPASPQLNYMSVDLMRLGMSPGSSQSALLPHLVPLQQFQPHPSTTLQQQQHQPQQQQQLPHQQIQQPSLPQSQQAIQPMGQQQGQAQSQPQMPNQLLVQNQAQQQPQHQIQQPVQNASQLQIPGQHQPIHPSALQPYPPYSASAEFGTQAQVYRQL